MGVCITCNARQVQLPAGGESAQVKPQVHSKLGSGKGAGLNLEGSEEAATPSAAATPLPPRTSTERGPSNSAARGRAHFTGKVSFTKPQTVWGGRGVQPVKRQAPPHAHPSRRRQGASRRELGRGKVKSRAPRHCVSGRRVISKAGGDVGRERYKADGYSNLQGQAAGPSSPPHRPSATLPGPFSPGSRVNSDAGGYLITYESRRVNN